MLGVQSVDTSDYEVRCRLIMQSVDASDYEVRCRLTSESYRQVMLGARFVDTSDNKVGAQAWLTK